MKLPTHAAFFSGISLILLSSRLLLPASNATPPLIEISPRQGSAPPAEPPHEVRGVPPSTRTARGVQLQSPPAGLIKYSIGEPTDEEQLYLEFINRSRANPRAEAQRFHATTDPDVLEEYKSFKVDLDLMVLQFALLTPAPPVSMNGALTAAARLHSQDMLANQFQGHTGSDGKTTGARITAQSYQWTAYGENVFSRAQSVWHGHAAFDVDWGGEASNGGMQVPPGHRETIHDPIYREVGIGIVKGRNGDVGPQLVTQDFGSGRDLTPFVTGVAYYDLNQNSAYDPGEGLPGVTVLVEGSRFYSVSSASGGYSVPVPANGTYTVSFSVPSLPAASRSVTVANNQNVKIDLTPAYSAPTLSGTDLPAVGQNNLFQFTAVGGAQSYQWKQNRRIPATEREGAESGLARVVVATSAGYEVINSAVKASGGFSFHLAHPDPEDQILTLTPLYRVTQSSQLVFASRLGFAGSAQIARAQLSADGGVNWQDVWSQVGTGDRGQVAFAAQAIPLQAFAGQEVMLRFRYDLTSGPYFPATDPGLGFYVDDVGITQAEEMLNEAIGDIPSGTSLSFNPTGPGDYSLRVRAILPNRVLPWGPAKLMTAQLGGVVTSSIKIAAVARVALNLVQIDFDVSGSVAGAFELEIADSVRGPWLPNPAAPVVSLGVAGKFRTLAIVDATPQRFYRLRAR